MSLNIIAFETRYSPDGKAEDWLHYSSRDALTATGSLTHSTWQRVDRLRPIEGDGEKARFFRARWADIEPAYQAWKAGNEIPETGVALAAWSGVTPDQAEVLKTFKLRTVEDVAELSETLVERIPLPNLRVLREQAAGFLKSRDGAAAADEIADLKRQLAEAMDMAAEAKAAATKRGPGRPSKEEAEAA